MAQILAFIPDLLFGSRVQSMLVTAGNQVSLVAGGEGLRERLDGTDVLVVDLTDQELSGVEFVRSLVEDGSLDGVRTLGFYSHVDVDARKQAEDAGFDLVVPRSRIAREGATLVARLIDG